MKQIGIVGKQRSDARKALIGSYDTLRETDKALEDARKAMNLIDDQIKRLE